MSIHPHLYKGFMIGAIRAHISDARRFLAKHPQDNPDSRALTKLIDGLEDIAKKMETLPGDF